MASDRLVVAGDSAGGGLAASLVLACRERGLDQPAGIVCCSPWADLTVSAASYVSNADVDRLFSHEAASTAAAMYLAGHDPTDPHGLTRVRRLGRRTARC